MEQHKQEELDFFKNRIELLYKIVKILLQKKMKLQEITIQAFSKTPLQALYLIL